MGHDHDGRTDALGPDGDHRRPRAGTRATIVIGQLPIEHWHARIGDATIAEAILERLLSRSQSLQLKGKSLRPPRAGGTAIAQAQIAAQASASQ